MTEPSPISPSMIAFIPARGGSKGIPGKNIIPIAGKPLLLWVLEAASACPFIDQVVLSTDDDLIAATASNHALPKLHIHRRHPDTATDTASTESAMLEYASAQSFQHMVLIQATSPLLTTEDLSQGISHYLASGADTMLSAVRQKRFLWELTPQGEAQPVNYNPAARPRRQDFKGSMVENGAFYITPRKGLLEHQNRLFGEKIIWEMPDETFLELDEPSDWTLIETHLLSRQLLPAADLSDRFCNIRLFLTDVDGVLTDSGMYYSETGDELKKFNTRDAVGLRQLKEQGISIGIITTEETQLVKRRAEKMNVDFLFQGCRDKTIPFKYLLNELNLTPENVAFIGDDENDRSLLTLVGLAATPHDGHPCLRSLVHYVCQAKGGEGSVRELADQILNAIHSKQ